MRVGTRLRVGAMARFVGLAAAFALWILSGCDAGAGVLMLPPGKELLGPEIPEPPIDHSQPPRRTTLGKVRIAVADGDAGKLAGLTAHDAPFVIVAPSDKPDLVWDPTTHNVNSGSMVVAFKVALADLGLVIDRTAVLRVLEQKAAARPQKIRLATSSKLYHVRDEAQIEVDDIAKRALLLIFLSGDGETQLLYPFVVSDERILPKSPYIHPLSLTPPPPPLGAFVFIAISAAKPIDELEQEMKRSDTMSATAFLALLDKTLPQDALIGLLTLPTAP